MSKTMLKATHEGDLKIGDLTIQAYNLPDKTRVLSRIGFLKALGRTGKAKGGRKYDDEFKTPIFLTANNLKPYISNELLENSKPIHFIDPNGSEAIGYRAELLPSVCYVFLDAKEAGDLKANQEHIAEKAKILTRAFATVGIIALIDEATGYQDVRVADELEKILHEILLEKAKKYSVTYPLELYKQMFRLNGWDWKPENAQKRPGVIGKWTNDLIYERMAPGLLTQLERRNPKNEKGYRDHKHFQFLTDEVGEPKLREYFGGLLALARANTNWRKFYSMVEMAFPKPPKVGDQLKLIPPDVQEKE
jgi:hypothetical protein